MVRLLKPSVVTMSLFVLSLTWYGSSISADGENKDDRKDKFSIVEASVDASGKKMIRRSIK